MLFWLANIISSKALEGNPTLEEVLAMTPPPNGRKHWVFVTTCTWHRPGGLVRLRQSVWQDAKGWGRSEDGLLS